MRAFSKIFFTMQPRHRAITYSQGPWAGGNGPSPVVARVLAGGSCQWAKVMPLGYARQVRAARWHMPEDYGPRTGSTPKMTLSLEEWKAEYYPVDAQAAAGTALEATQHSLRKWRGMSSEVMRTYGVEQLDVVMFTDCALCCYGKRYAVDDPCSECPLAHTLGRSCDQSSDSVASEWRSWCRNRDTEPMITALERTLTRLYREADGLIGRWSSILKHPLFSAVKGFAAVCLRRSI